MKRIFIYLSIIIFPFNYLFSQVQDMKDIAWVNTYMVSSNAVNISNELKLRHAQKNKSKFSKSNKSDLSKTNNLFQEQFEELSTTNESVNFSEKEILILNEKIIEFLKKYERLTNELGQSIGIDEKKSIEIKEAILEQFLNRKISVFNDLDPTRRTSKEKEIDTYLSDIILLYPDGIKIKLDFQNAKITGINRHQKNIFYVDIILQKIIDGNYNNVKENKLTPKLTFRIAFLKSKSKFTNFKIVGIRNYQTQQVSTSKKMLEELNKINLTKTQIDQINNKSKSLLSDYFQNLKLIGNPKEDDEDKVYYEKAFVKLFKDSSSILFNDINPELKEENMSATKYIKQYRHLYPKGYININLNIDSADFKPVLKQDNYFYRYIYVDKNFSGNYKEKKKYSISRNLVFTLVFEKQENAFVNFRIANIEQSELGFYNGNKSEQIDTTSYKIKRITRKGLSMGFGILGGQGIIEDKNKLSEQLDGKKLWSLNPNYSYSANINVSYFLSDNFGWLLGVQYTVLSTKYELMGKYNDGENTTKDLNGDDFIKNINASKFVYDEDFSFIDIPLQINRVFSKPRKLGVYIDAGVIFSFPVITKASQSGQYEYYGIYPYFDETIQKVTLEELSFYNVDYDNNETKFNTSEIALSISGALGVCIPIGYFTELKIGTEINFGLSDILQLSSYNNIFNEESENLGVYSRNYGITLSLNYKFKN